jgi:cyclopropane-fatty-acyl-phospholipid synthase
MPDGPVQTSQSPLHPAGDWLPHPAPPRIRNLWLRTLVALARRIGIGQCTLILPGGGQIKVAGGRGEPGLRPVIEIKRARAARRLLLGGDVAFAEAYMDGDWTCQDLPAFLELALRNESALAERIDGLAPARWLRRLVHRLRDNSRRGSRRNIARHYDLGNDFYRLWLDRSMTYSSALFASDDEPLATAQDRKYRNLAEMLSLRPGQHVLEIGCGWGRFAELAAGEYGCRVTAITLSHAQAAYARRRILMAGLADQVEIRIQDYRDVTGQFDRIASIEMFEAVGEAYWPSYFATLKRCLAPAGRACVQTIVIADELFDRYRIGSDFIQQYIFPGGMLPSPDAFHREARRAGLAVVNEHAFGVDYARTLATWRQRFLGQLDRVRALGFDARFIRTWDFYLAYCEAAFARRNTDVVQYTLIHA